MKRPLTCLLIVAVVVLWSSKRTKAGESRAALKPQLHTSDRCFACHNELTATNEADISIGLNWRASIMANSARDPYWQASVRRETIDHSQSGRAIEDECSVCHMPITRYKTKVRG